MILESILKEKRFAKDNDKILLLTSYDPGNGLYIQSIEKNKKEENSAHNSSYRRVKYAQTDSWKETLR